MAVTLSVMVATILGELTEWVADFVRVVLAVVIAPVTRLVSVRTRRIRFRAITRAIRFRAIPLTPLVTHHFILRLITTRQ